MHQGKPLRKIPNAHPHNYKEIKKGIRRTTHKQAYTEQIECSKLIIKKLTTENKRKRLITGVNREKESSDMTMLGEEFSTVEAKNNK